MLTIEEVQRDNTLENEFVEQNIPLVKAVIGRYFKSALNSQRFDEYFQLGCIGLIKAVKGFDSSFGVKFSTYAVPMIQGEIRRYRRDYEGNEIKVSRSKKEAYHKYASLRDSGLPDSEVCMQMGISLDELDIIKGSIPELRSMSDAVYHNKNGDAIPLEECISDGVNLENDVISRIDIQRCIQRMQETLSEKDNGIFRNLLLGKTQTEIGSAVGVSQVEVSRRIKVIREVFKSELTGENAFIYKAQACKKKEDPMNIDREKLKKLLEEGKSIEEIAKLMNAHLGALKSCAVRWGLIQHKQPAALPAKPDLQVKEKTPDKGLKWREEKPRALIRPTAWKGNGREYSLIGSVLVIASTQDTFSIDKKDLEALILELGEIAKIVTGFDEFATG